mgnify:FL=1
MSDLQTIAQQVSGFVSNAESATVLVRTYSAQVNQMLIWISNALQGANQQGYQELLNQLLISKKKLDYAADCLLSVSKYGTDWLNEHFIPAGTGNNSSNNTVIDVNGAESQTFQRPDPDCASNPYVDLLDEIDNNKVSYLPFKSFSGERSEEDIIERLGGGDQTDGSCSSLAFAYCGNKAGYDVLDFRDGKSRKFFGNKKHVQRIAELSNVKAKIEWGKDDEVCTNRLMTQMEPGKEYYLGTGQHAAIVRLNNGRYEYLELQQPKEFNGWYPLNPATLFSRFGCDVYPMDFPSFLIEVESLANSREFLDLLGYINTAESEQNKGDAGYAK